MILAGIRWRTVAKLDMMPFVCLLAAFAAAWAHGVSGRQVTTIRSLQSGSWSNPGIWEGGKIPGAGSRVQIRSGHRVSYDVAPDTVIRSIHVSGTLTFAPDRDTRLNVGLIKVQPGDDFSENGFDCDSHSIASPMQNPKSKIESAILVGTPDHPIDPGHIATIRLTYVEGMDKETCPALVCCGGRMEIHGAAMNRTWVKLAETAKSGDATVNLAESVTGWRAGDRVILVATERQHKPKKTFTPSVRDHSQTEERPIKSINGTKITLDGPLTYEHLVDGDFRGEVANLSRNVVIESADPAGVRGHTMYHRGSAGSISYAEFRHLGKAGILGKYSIHFHLAGDTMRGASVVGASIWDSDNRWITIHGTNYLIVRDCVGYRSTGHGFFLEDGTEVFNVLDRNLAVDAFYGKPLPKQAMPFDINDGAGFWWANSLNTFTRNVAAECDEYGYWFSAEKTADFEPTLTIQQPDGSLRKVDIRTLPFIRFEDNESHTQRRHAFNLGGGRDIQRGGVDGVGPDERHPFVIRNMTMWDTHWSFHPVTPCLLVENLRIENCDYGMWNPVYNRHAYKNVQIRRAKIPEPAPATADYPKPLDPIDDLPPATVITHVLPAPNGKVLVRGATSDNGIVKRVLVNGMEARATRPNFAEWEITLISPTSAPLKLTAHSEDAAGNVEKRPHVLERIAPSNR